MAKGAYQLTVTDDSGNVRRGAQVRVTEAGTSNLANLFQDRAGATPLDNPFAADDNGFARFYAAQGMYDIRVTYAGNQRDHLYVPVFETVTLTAAAPVYQLATPNAGTTHDYAPGGFTSATTDLDLSPGAGNAELGGLAGGGNGQEVIVTNVHASNNVKLLAEASGSTAANRFRLAYDLTLPPGTSVRMKYLSATARWSVCP